MTPSGIIINSVHFCTWQMSEIKHFYFNPKRIGLQVKPGCCAALQIIFGIFAFSTLITVY